MTSAEKIIGIVFHAAEELGLPLMLVGAACRMCDRVGRLILQGRDWADDYAVLFATIGVVSDCRQDHFECRRLHF